MILRNFSLLFLLTLSLTLVFIPITNVYAVVPGQVTGLTATAQTNALTIDLSWTAVTATPAVTGYKIERKVGVGAFSDLVANTGSTATTYSDTGLSQGTTYTYRVSAINADGTGTASAEASATTNSAPDAPTSLTATKQTNALTVDLSWTAPASNGGSAITGYKIERESPVGGGFSTLVANTGSTTTSYSDTGLSQGTQYNYRVSAINAIGTGSASNTASATTNSAPGTPTGLTATAQADVLTIDLSWTAPASNGGSVITGYKIERKIGTGAFSTLVANTASTSTSYSDTGLSQGTQYTYRISAINAIGTGSASSESSATTSDVPATPTLSVTVTKLGISLSWTTPNNMGSSITGYKIERASPADSTYVTLVGNTGTTTTTFLDSTVTKQQSVSYRISAINAIGTGSASNISSATSFSASATCSDCNSPSFNEEKATDEFPLVIGKKAFKLPTLANKIDTVSVKTGTALPIKLSLYDDSGPDHIQHVALYLNLKENQLTESQSDTYIIWEKGQEVVVHDPHGFLKDTKVTVQISSEDNQELEVTFDLFFVKPLEKSHIIVSMWDDKRNGSIVKMFDALKVTEGETQTDQALIEGTAVQNTPTISARLKEEIKKIAKDGMTDDDIIFMLNELAKEGIDFKQLSNKQKEMSLMESRIITSEFQDGKVSVEKGYSAYYELLIVKGDIPTYRLGTNIELEITKPDTPAQVLSLYADKNGYFYVPIMLDDIKEGNYLIKASYMDATIGELKFTLVDNTNTETYASNVEDIVRLWLQGKITEESFLKRLNQIVK